MIDEIFPGIVGEITASGGEACRITLTKIDGANSNTFNERNDSSLLAIGSPPGRNFNSNQNQLVVLKLAGCFRLLSRPRRGILNRGCLCEILKHDYDFAD